VTKKGGHVVLMNVARDIGDKTIDLAESIKRAGAFLREVGITNMTPTFASEVGDVSIVPFVYMQDGVLIYPDQLKVKGGVG